MNTIFIHSEGDSDDLVPPQLFQAPNQILDLVTLNPGDPVVVGVFLRDAKDGEEFTVCFGDKQKKATVARSARYIHDVMFEISGDLPPVGKTYAVSYSFRGKSSPSVSVELVDSTPDFLAPRFHECSLRGSYLPGLLDAWIVPGAYLLTNDVPIIRPIGDRMPAADELDLEIFWQSGPGVANRVGTISYKKAAGSWQVNIFDEVKLLRGDMLSIQMPAGVTDFIGLAVCL